MQKNTWRALTMSIVILTAACGGSGGQTSTSPTAPTGSTTTGAAGIVTISSTAINNQSGKVLLVLAEQEGRQVARACVAIATAAFSLPATVMVEIAASGNPCDDSKTRKTFASGSYTLTAGIYVPGSQTPEKRFTQPFRVDGNVNVAVDGTQLGQ